MLVHSILITLALLQGCLATPRADCKTVEGPDCVFPFRYMGKLYNKCTKVDHNSLWCSTKTYSNDNYVWVSYSMAQNKSWYRATILRGNNLQLTWFRHFWQLVGRYCSYLLPRQDGGTSQI